MLVNILNAWRRLLLLKEERILSEIFVLSSKDLRELQVSERFGAPSFMRIDEKRWCQPSVWKGGKSFRPRFSLAGKPGNKIGGKIKNKRRWFRKCSLRVGKKVLH
jgi:hypothetical protein